MKSFLATYSDMRPVKTRSVIQIILEVPVEHADAAYQVLGGFARPGQERWVEVSLFTHERKEVMAKETVSIEEPKSRSETLDKLPAGTPKGISKTKPLAQQAGFLCSQPMFQKFLQERGGHSRFPANAEDAADLIRMVCKVASRSEIDEIPSAAAEWQDLVSQYEAWKLVA